MENQNSKDTLSSEVPTTNTAKPSAPSSSNYGKRSWVKWFLVYLIIAAVIYAGVYYLLQSKQNPKPYSTTVPTPTIISQPTPTPDPTANWKTYTDKNKTFTFKYPSNWEEPTVNLQSTHTDYSFSSANLFIKVGFSYNQNLGRALTYQEEIANEEKFALSTKNITVSGIQTKKYIEKFGVVHNDDIVILKGKDLNTIYKISMPFYRADDENTFDQILSTFKFLDQKQTDETANWKTYTNTKLKFTFRYPQEWIIKNLPNGAWASLESPDYQVDDQEHIDSVAKNGAEMGIPMSNDAGGEKSYTSYFGQVREGMIVKSGDISSPEKIFNIRRVNIAGKTTLVYDFQSTSKPKLMGVRSEIVLMDGKYYNFEMIYASEYYKETFNQILSTFRFVE